MLSTDTHNQGSRTDTFNYGWVIVAVCVMLLFMRAGVMYSFGVFFKYLVADFGWSRAATSGVFSLFLVFHGSVAVVMGWLVDRLGPRKIMVFCGLLTGLGLVLTSRVSALWQIYVTYGLIVGAGLSAGFTTSLATTARWFVKRRGLALGIVSSGVGLGTLVVVPIADRLIASYGWPTAYFILGVAAWIIMVPGAFFLKRGPEQKKPQSGGKDEPTARSNAAEETGIGMKAALRYRSLWLMVCVFLFFNFCLQIVTVHLVNYATDIGIASLIAASFVSIIGVGSTIGRLIMGTMSDKIGSDNSLLVCCVGLLVTMVFLLFARELWMFYLFAILFGFAYGGEVPQMAALVGQFFGLRALAALVGIALFGTTIGGAIGAWVAGRVFDLTQSYQIAFTIAAIVSVFAVLVTVMLKKARPAFSGSLPR